MDKQIKRFLKRKSVVKVLGENYKLTTEQYNRLTKLFEEYGSPKNIENMLETVAKFVKFNLSNYKGRYRRLVGTNGTTTYTQMLRYGKYFDEVMTSQTERKTKHFQNKVDFWTSKGFTEEESNQKVSKIQKSRSLLSPVTVGGTNKYSCRAIDFWINRGFSLDAAKDKVRKIQTNNGIDFYMSKGHSYEEAKTLQQDRNIKWIKTMENNNDMDLVHLKRGHSTESYVARGYTIDDAKRLSKEFYSRISRFSKISQELFTKLINHIGKENVFCEVLNYEYQINGKFVDFFHSGKGIVIEFYGDYWHGNPDIYDETFMIRGKTAKTKREEDRNRQELIKSNKDVSKIIVVWEKDYIDNPEKVINDLLRELI